MRKLTVSIVFLFAGFASASPTSCPEALRASIGEARTQLEQAREMAQLLGMSLKGSDAAVSSLLAELESIEFKLQQREHVEVSEASLAIRRADILGRLSSSRETGAGLNVRARTTLRDGFDDFQFL